MHHIYSTLALDIARDRTREAAHGGSPMRLAVIDHPQASAAVFGPSSPDPRSAPVEPTFTPDAADCA